MCLCISLEGGAVRGCLMSMPSMKIISIQNFIRWCKNITRNDKIAMLMQGLLQPPPQGMFISEDITTFSSLVEDGEHNKAFSVCVCVYVYVSYVRVCVCVHVYMCLYMCVLCMCVCVCVCTCIHVCMTVCACMCVCSCTHVWQH